MISPTSPPLTSCSRASVLSALTATFRFLSGAAVLVFVVGGPWWGGYGYYDNGYYDDGCWQWIETRRGLRRVWACGDPY